MGKPGGGSFFFCECVLTINSPVLCAVRMVNKTHSPDGVLTRDPGAMIIREVVNNLG